jgi:hypothetical protein
LASYFLLILKIPRLDLLAHGFFGGGSHREVNSIEGREAQLDDNSSAVAHQLTHIH